MTDREGQADARAELRLGSPGGQERGGDLSRRRGLVMCGSMVALALALAACSAAPKPVAPTPSGPTCAGAAEHMVDEMAAAKDPRPPDDTLNALIGLIRTRCDQDRWSPRAVACLSTMKSATDADRCGTLLTDAQQAALVRDQEAKPRAGD